MLFMKKTKAYKHFAGTSLLLAAISMPVLMALLPSRSATDINLPFLNNSQKPVVLAFAGYPGCNTVCPISLSVLRDAYQDYYSQYSSINAEVMFINIQLNTPDEITNAYAKFYHPNFSGYSVKSNEAHDIYKALSLQTFNNNKDSNRHAGYIYLFVRIQDKWNIEHVYQQLPSPKEIISDLKGLKQIT